MSMSRKTKRACLSAVFAAVAIASGSFGLHQQFESDSLLLQEKAQDKRFFSDPDNPYMRGMGVVAKDIDTGPSDRAQENAYILFGLAGLTAVASGYFAHRSINASHRSHRSRRNHSSGSQQGGAEPSSVMPD